MITASALESLSPDEFARLAVELDQLDQKLGQKARAELTRLAHGNTLAELVRNLRDALAPEAIQAAAALLAANESGCPCSGGTPPEPTDSQIQTATDQLVRRASAPFVRNVEFRALLCVLFTNSALPLN